MNLPFLPENHILPNKFLDIDFETRSEVDITEVGAKGYAQHPSTEIMMVSFSSDQEEVTNWNPFTGRKSILLLFKKLVRRVQKSKRKFVIRAQNDAFEYYIWKYVATRQFGWPELPRELFYDSMAVGCINGLPSALEKAGIATEGNQQKDKQGTSLINFFSKPSRAKGETFKDPLIYREKFDNFISYCDDDVRTQISVCDFGNLMTARQHQIFLLTEYMNIRGIPIDRDMCRGAVKLAEMYKERANKEIQKLTKGAIESPTQTKTLNEWLNANGYKMPNLRAETIEKVLKKLNPKSKFARILRLRQGASKTSVSKYVSGLKYSTDEYPTVHGAIKAFIAITGRWGGRDLQIQNFSKPDDKTWPKWVDEETLCELITNAELDLLEIIYGDIMEVLKSATRHLVCAPPGYKFVSADYSQIEARIVMWIANCIQGLKDFAGEGKIYENMAAEIFSMAAANIRKPSFERDVGKETVLGCGFGMGADKFLFRCVEQRNLKLDGSTSKRAVKGYRERYPEVVDAWGECERCAIAAIENPGEIFKISSGKISYRMVGRSLYAKLPSGRKLCYPFAKVEHEINRWNKPTKAIYYKHWNDKAPAGKKWEYQSIWGGTLFQHAVQGTATDVMADGMMNAERKGYPCLFTVHDESVSMVKEDYGSYQEYEGILCELKPCFKGLPVVAEGWEGKRYRK